MEKNIFNFFLYCCFKSSRPNPGRREKIKLNFYFHTSLWCFKKAFIKPFEASQKSVKIKIYPNFYFNITFRMQRALRVKQLIFDYWIMNSLTNTYQIFTKLGMSPKLTFEQHLYTFPMAPSPIWSWMLHI